MIIQNSVHYGYHSTPFTQETAFKEHKTQEQRQTYGTALLSKLDDRAYQAFVNSTASFNESDKRLAAKALERVAALSAANQYAVTHGIERTNDLSLVYQFFENYQDTVSSDQIKHLLNTRLLDGPSFEGKDFESERFFSDYLAQLGGSRKLDIKV